MIFLKLNTRKRICLVLAALMVLSAFASLPANASGKGGKDKKTYDIAIAYDNSGSMYTDGSKLRWCHAQYAMEIFASMLDFAGGDRMAIYTMWPIKTDGSSTPTGSAEDKGDDSYRITITSESDVQKLKNMYTPYARGTPFKPVLKASEYLSGSSASEKWLIILTDGEFDSASLPNGSTVNSINAIQQNTGVHIQFIGIDNDISDISSNRFDVLGGKGSDIRSDLITACNRIFKRDILVGPGKKGNLGNYLNGKELTLDVSMGKLIVFVQGNGAEVESLVDKSGKSIRPEKSSKAKYNEIGSAINVNGDPNYPLSRDNTLYGQVVTFGACSKGTYTLNLKGTDAYNKVQIFYEPAVDIEAALYTEGNSETPSEKINKDTKELSAGDYILKFKLIDSETKEDITNHPLLGGNVNLTADITQSNGNKQSSIKSGDTIHLSEDDSTTIVVEGTYLDDYKISSKDSQSIPFPIKIGPPSFDGNSFVISAKADRNSFKKTEVANWNKVEVTLSIDGKALTAEQFANTTLTKVEAQPKLACNWEKSGDHFVITLAHDGSDYVKDVAPGGYTLNIEAEMSGYSSPVKASTTFSFSVSDSALEVKLSPQQSSAQFKREKAEDWTKITATLKLDGKPLSKEEFEKTDLDVSFSKSMPYTKVPDPDSSSYIITLANDGSGTVYSFDTGDYVLTATATYDKSASQPPTASDKYEFTVTSSALDVSLKPEEKSPQFKKDNAANWSKIIATLSLDGAPLTAEQLNKTDLDIKFNKDMPYTYSRDTANSSFIITLANDGSSTVYGFESGEYKMDVDATYDAAANQPSKAAASYEFTVIQAEFAVRLKTEQAGNWFCISEHDTWKPIYAEFTYEGAPLTPEQFNQLNVDFTINDGVEFTVKEDKENQRYEIELGRNAAGEFVRPANGSYTIKATAKMADNTGEAMEVTDSLRFSVRTMPFWMLLLIIILILLVIAAIVLFFMSRKVLPKDLKVVGVKFMTIKGAVDVGKNVMRYNRKQKTLQVRTPGTVPFEQACTATFSLMACDRRWTPSSRRGFIITKISALQGFEVTINNIPYVFNTTLHSFISALNPTPPAKVPETLTNRIAVARVEINNKKVGKNMASLYVEIKPK